MKKYLRNSLLIILIFTSALLSAQNLIRPSGVTVGVYYGASKPLIDIKPSTNEEKEDSRATDNKTIFNPKIGHRSYPYDKYALPKNIDGVLQNNMGELKNKQSTIVNFESQQTTTDPPDANCMSGKYHVMQMVNSTYAVYSKTGEEIIAATSVDSLFSGIPNLEGIMDPLIIYDAHANRWVAIMYVTVSGNRILVAISKTDDPTGEWDRWAFITNGEPDFEKMGIWRNGYYFGTNTQNGDNIYILERTQMLGGNPTPKMIKFNNSFVSGYLNGMTCTMPVDTDGPFARNGEPGIFLTLNDDALSGVPDALWVYECYVDWDTIANSYFSRVQQLLVSPFNSNFGNNFNNITQKNTPQKLETNPEVLSYRVQYRNFDTVEIIMCIHTVNMDGSGHAGIRWYELEKQNSDTAWTIRQQSTYGPDKHNRWMGSIAMNANREIALGYSITSADIYPGIRYTGQSANANKKATGIMDIAEEIIINGSYPSTYSSRWGDYTCMSVDPTNNETFWYTSQYVDTINYKFNTRIASIKIEPTGLAPNFVTHTPTLKVGNSIRYIDFSTGNPSTWKWTFYGGIPSSFIGQNPPEITYDSIGRFDVTLEVLSPDTSVKITKEKYVNVLKCSENNLPYNESFENNGRSPFCWDNELLMGTMLWQFLSGTGGNGNPYSAHTGTYNASYNNYSTTTTPGVRLISPKLDFSDYKNAWVTFWYVIQAETELSILYKNSDTITSWTLLKKISNSGENWTKDSISLPNISDKYYLAFEGLSNNGLSVSLDDITIDGTPREPVADFTAEPLEGTIPHTVKFTDHSTGHINTRHWTFGDGNESFDEEPEHTYSKEGQYDVSLTATGDNGVSSTKTREGYISVLVGIDDNSTQIFLVYPNPVTNTLKIEFTEKRQRKLILSDNKGNRILTKMSNLKKDSIKLGNLSAGIYFLTVMEDGKSVATLQVIKN